jgi:mono/diheme cytochrome c family protein
MSTLSIPYALQAHDLSGRTTDPDNVQRVQQLLANVDFGDQEVEVETITTPDGFDAGRETLVRKCTVCHDMRTILAKPRTAQKWYDVSYRMLDKPSVFGQPLLAEEIPAVTAYLTAVTPAIQESTKRRRKQEERAEEATEAVVTAIADSAGEDVAAIPEEEGEALLQQHCVDCHELDEVTEYGGADAAGWRSVIAAMVDEGAEYDAETTEQLVAYLVQAYPPTEKAKEREAAKAAEVAAEAETGEGDEESGDDEGETVEVVDDEGESGEGDGGEGEQDAGSEETEEEPAAEKPKPKKPKPKKPKKPAIKADSANGSRIYMKKCKSCHGVDGRGNTPFGKKLEVASIRNVSRSKIKRAIVRGVPGTKMRSFSGKLTKQEIEDVTAFTKGL